MNSFELYKDIINLYREVDLECNLKLDDVLKKINNKGTITTVKEVIRELDNNELEVLAKCGRLDLSLENLILDEKYRYLFNEEDIEICKERLNKYKNIENKDEE
ncbi:hypothetical protein ACFO6R_09690 [Eubacterium multiforme]|uniref:Uncharacterized protein n=1 Tax=Eubacterium multiforme TaxID=83339 RepID=A0ABT9USY0_9FIRM|nr:hypothetical protein [Eubacterium multiforme]MDQ0149448.1 hypothetical protein [Eubacterium multiforme]